MPTFTVKLTPGVNTELTPTFNEGAYQTTNLIRWAPSGLPQKLGGWTRYYPFAIGSIVRALHAWEDLSGILHLGIGSVDSLNVLTEGYLQNITPQIRTDNPTVNFSTTSGSTAITITDVGSDATVYDVLVIKTPISVGGIILSGAYPITLVTSADTYQIQAASPATATVTSGGVVPQFAATTGNSTITVTFPNHGQTLGSSFSVTVPTTVGGVTLSGFYTVNSVIDANDFTINASAQAASTQTFFMNGGNAQFDYYITGGPPTVTTGFGIGPFGAGGFGTGSEIPPITGTPITVTDYTLDNWGGYLIACPANGPIFVWQPNSGFINAQMIAQAPVANVGAFVSMPAQILVAYGSSVLGVLDPLLINWCDAGNYTVWTAAVTNQAGSYRLPRGSAIIGGIQGPQYALIWTDLAVWAMSYIGTPYVFSFNELASGCGLIGKFANAVLGTTVYWMSQKGFFALPSGGSVVPVPCTVWDFIFQNLDTANASKIRAAANSQFGEVTWYFPSLSSGGGENDCYVKFTPSLSAWDYGYLGRSAWIDQSVLGPPVGSDPRTQFIYQHETSNDADGAAMLPYLQTGYFALNEGEDISFVDLVMPDMKWGFMGGAQTASVQITFKYADYPTGEVYQNGPFTMSSTGPAFINARFRARLASVEISSFDTGTFWRLGALRIRSAPDGRL